MKKKANNLFSNTPLCKNASCLAVRRHGGPDVGSQKTFLSGPSRINLFMFGLDALLKTALSGLSFPQTTSACFSLVHVYYGVEKKRSDFAMVCLLLQMFFLSCYIEICLIN